MTHSLTLISLCFVALCSSCHKITLPEPIKSQNGQQNATKLYSRGQKCWTWGWINNGILFILSQTVCWNSLFICGMDPKAISEFLCLVSLKHCYTTTRVWDICRGLIIVIIGCSQRSFSASFYIKACLHQEW